MTPKPFVDFYAKNEISPVSQDISNLKKHFAVRGALYKHLGLAPALVKGCTVLEFGPGSGFNSIYTQALAPSRYVLVDGNSVGLEQTATLLAKHGDGTIKPELHESYIEDFTSDELFDLVLCEGVIPTQKNPSAFLKKVASHVAPGGVLVITCIDSVSYLSELLRRAVAFALVREEMELNEKVQILTPIFAPHLATLTGMSRPVEDWILDNMIQPFYGPLFSIGEALTCLEKNFVPYGTSPRFLTDWHWHKAIHDETSTRAVKNYQSEVHNLIDHNRIFPTRPATENLPLIQSCQAVCDAVYSFAETRKKETLAQICSLVEVVAKEVNSFSPEVATALHDYNHTVETFLSSGKLKDFASFAGLFGRGQQYLSFLKPQTL